MKRTHILALSLLCLLVVIPAVAAASGTGPTSTVLDMPVQWTFTGLTASTAYDVICTTGSNHTVIDAATSDSTGALTVTINYFYSTGSNHYVVELDAAGTKPSVEFNIDNMDIMPYFILMITVSILFSLMAMFKGKKGGLF